MGCKGACKDTHNDCPGWAIGGECTSNPGHTLKHCPFSCGVCKAATSEGPKECKDKNSTACAIWSLNDECLRNPEHMHTECAATCGVCTTVCEDKAADCASWAADGECEENPNSMMVQCPQSCGLCHGLESFYRTAVGGDPKDEL